MAAAAVAGNLGPELGEVRNGWEVVARGTDLPVLKAVDKNSSFGGSAKRRAGLSYRAHSTCPALAMVHPDERQEFEPSELEDARSRVAQAEDFSKMKVERIIVALLVG